MRGHAGPRYVLDRESWSYKYKDEYGVWWWRCICSQSCWDHLQYRDPRSLRAHQTSKGTALCQVDPNFIPPIHESTVVVGHGGVTGPNPAQARAPLRQQVHHHRESNPPAVPSFSDEELGLSGDLRDLQDDPAIFDPGSFHTVVFNALSL
jgi:hypothetical protein